VASYLGRPSPPDDAQDASPEGPSARSAAYEAPGARVLRISGATQLEVAWPDGSMTVLGIS